MTLRNDQTSRRRRSGTFEAQIDSADAASTQAIGDDGRPLSRRAARERERRAAEALAAGQQHPSGVLDFGSHSLARDFGVDETFDEHSTADIWEALSRRAEEAPVSPAAEPEAVAAPVAEVAAVADVTIAEPAPGVRRRGRRAAAVEPEAQAPQVTLDTAPVAIVAPVPVDEVPVDEVPVDEAPVAAKAGSGAFAAPINYPAPITGGQPVIAPVTDELLERVRHAVLHSDRAAETVAATPAAPERPLTRRELRAQQAAETVDGMPAAWFAGDAEATPAVAAPAAFSGTPDEADYLDIATVQMSALDHATLEAQAPMTAPVDIPQLFSQPIGRDEIAFSSPVLPVAAEPLAAHPGAVAEPAFVEPEPVAAGVEPDTDEDRTDLAGFEALISRSRGRTPSVPHAAQLPTQTGPTRQAASPIWQAPQDAEDQHAGFAGLLSRNVGLAQGSQNALIMAQDPQPDITKAVNGTGELFITGSLNLSRTLATTGATPQHYDALEIDRLFEASQDEPSANVAPVRASRAVSSSGTGRSISPRRTRSSVLPIVLAIVAGVMALGVIALIVGSRLVGAF